MKKSFKVLVAVSNNNPLGRLFVGGIARYACVQPDWDVRFISQREDDFPADELARQRFDGVITAFTDLPPPLCHGNAKIIRLWPGNDLPEFPSAHRIVADETITGQIVATYFLERGFRNFAFAGGLQSGVWSDFREKSFTDALQKSGYACSVYKHGGRNAPRVFRHAQREDTRTCEWLKTLPKPVAIFAAYDRRGQQILRCCRKLGLAVPREVSVVGMDNDETICESCTPRLSSVTQNLEAVGELAARNLGKLMSGWQPAGSAPLVLHSHADGIVTRESSDINFGMGSSLVARALALIDNESSPVSTVAELVDRLHVSERLLRLRFRQNLGTTVHDAISAARLKRVCKMLRETELPEDQIAECCGFTDASHLAKVFRKEYGTNPLSFRKRG